ncbi:helix-turn-helix domain-containing protein [Lacticaseibacillus parakribbianus]|uniref:helix-turn-helix domain-containing protein n=1 Tax=Lacticaseibacillus parakribbianus TaxID=2970927 RepID=UPI0021CAEFD2|nr:helix-turn-helix transcriptional regulator [Lacticaseibacillus parakribbianus]
MAQSIGGFIRQLREARGISQAVLYAALLSPRQAIRFEAGGSVRADTLLALLRRLQVSAAALQAACDPLDETGDANMRAALGKLAAWGDWPLTPAEQKAVLSALASDDTLTLPLIQRIGALVARFSPLPWASYRRLWHKAQAFRTAPDYPDVALGLCIDVGFAALFGREAAIAADFLRRGQTVLAAAPATWQAALLPRLQFRFLTAIATAIPAGQATAAAAGDELIAGLRVLGEVQLADGFVDNRRHILTSFDLHPTWTEAELGGAARAMAAASRRVPDLDVAAYQRQLPGLDAALAGRPLSAFETEF